MNLAIILPTSIAARNIEFGDNLANFDFFVHLKIDVRIRGDFAGAGVFVRSDRFEYVLVSLGS